jgi:hypothetical protein
VNDPSKTTQNNKIVAFPDTEEKARSKKAPTDLTDERLETIAKDIETAHGTAVLYVAERLAEARDIFRYRRDEGGFSGWVEKRLHYSRSTAYNLLGIHEQFGGEKNLSKCLDTFPASILYLLAAPSTPKEARDKIIERAQAGETVSVAEAKRVIAKGRARPARKPTTKPQAGKSVGGHKKAFDETPVDDLIDEAAKAAVPKSKQDDFDVPLKPAHDRIARRLHKQFGEAPLPVQQHFIPYFLEYMRCDTDPSSTDEIARKDAEIEELRNAKRQLEISISEFQTAIKKLEETVEAQRGIIVRLKNENANLRAKVAALPDGAMTKRESGVAEATWSLDQIGIEDPHRRRHPKMPTELQIAAEKALARQTTLFDPENKVRKLLRRKSRQQS